MVSTYNRSRTPQTFDFFLYGWTRANVSLYFHVYLISEWKFVEEYTMWLEFLYFILRFSSDRNVKAPGEVTPNKQKKWKWKRNFTNKKYHWRCVLYLPQVTLQDLDNLWLLKEKEILKKVSRYTVSIPKIIWCFNSDGFTTFTDTINVNNCFSIHHKSWLISRSKISMMLRSLQPFFRDVCLFMFVCLFVCVLISFSSCYTWEMFDFCKAAPCSLHFWT